jgi:NAD(P)-dependent dehydrogenase (short-subunit alcohol dehydrogenase family)
MARRVAAPKPVTTTIPVQVIVPRNDVFVSTALQIDSAPFASARKVAGSHWLPTSQPHRVADYVRAFVKEKTVSKIVVITGAGSGIGAATARAYAKAGATVLLGDINIDTVTQVASDIGKAAFPYQLDVSDADAFTEFAKHVVKEHGVPDVLVNNAGIGLAGQFADTSKADWERIMGINVWGVIHGCQAFVPYMIKRGEGGQIINIASAAAYTLSKVYIAYSTTKAAVLAFSENLRAELARENIGVTAICPGVINTNIVANTKFLGSDQEAESYKQKKLISLYGKRNYSADRVAAQIMRAEDRNSAVVPVSAEARIMRIVSRLFPSLVRFSARFDVTALLGRKK